MSQFLFDFDVVGECIDEQKLVDATKGFLGDVFDENKIIAYFNERIITEAKLMWEDLNVQIIFGKVIVGAPLAWCEDLPDRMFSLSDAIKDGLYLVADEELPAAYEEMKKGLDLIQKKMDAIKK